MPAQIIENKGKKKNYWLLAFLAILLTVVFPAVLLAFNVYVFRRYMKEEPVIEEKVRIPEGFFQPSQILKDKMGFKDRRLKLIGKTELETITCERKECPPEDACCGCPGERDLLIADHDKELMRESAWRMRLLDKNAKPLCRREEDSCEYECPGWTVGDIYEVEGVFFADPPPPGSGWRLYEDVYFEVEGFQIIEQASGWDWPGRVLNGFQEIVGGLKKAGGRYVLQ